MIILLIILAVLAYAAIGGFITGFIQEDQMEMRYFLLWPVFLLLMLLSLVARFPYQLGKSISKRIRSRKL